MPRCSECVTEKTQCPHCVHNPLHHFHQNFFRDYNPICPRGFQSCNSNPDYLRKKYPEWYKELYGEKEGQ